MKRYDVNGTMRSLSDADAKRLGFDPEKDGVERGKWEANKARTPAQSHKKDAKPEGEVPDESEPVEPVPPVEPEPVPDEGETEDAESDAHRRPKSDTDAANKARRTRQS